jgi:hypothetical protein
MTGHVVCSATAAAVPTVAWAVSTAREAGVEAASAGQDAMSPVTGQVPWPAFWVQQAFVQSGGQSPAPAFVPHPEIQRKTNDTAAIPMILVVRFAIAFTLSTMISISIVFFSDEYDYSYWNNRNMFGKNKVESD